MSLLNSRLTKLETASMKESNRIFRVVHFLVNPGTAEVAGYEGNGRQILRLPGEYLASLQKRCSGSLTPEEDGEYFLFRPLYDLQTKHGGSHVIG